MTTSKTKIAKSNKKGKYVIVTMYGKYIEHIEKTGSIVMPLTTGDIDKALRTNNPDEITRKYGLQNMTIETFAENNK
jgi:hypothetical protein